MQQWRRQAAFQRDVDAGRERGFRPRALRIARREQELPAAHALPAGVDPRPSALLVAGERGDPDAGLGEEIGLRVLDQPRRRLRQSLRDRHLDPLVASGGQQSANGFGANIRRGSVVEGGEQPRPQRRPRLRARGQLGRGFTIGSRQLIAGNDVERGRPLGSGQPQLGRRVLVTGETEQKLRRGLGRQVGLERGLAVRSSELERNIVGDIDHRFAR